MVFLFPIETMEGSMVFRRALWALIWVSFLAFPVSARTISFLVVETGIGESAPATESSTFWESGLMDTFFEEGHIVSNARVLRLPVRPTQELPDEVGLEFNEARSWGADYFVLAILDYQGNTQGTPKPGQVSLRMYRVNPYQFIIEKRISGGRNAPVREELVNAKKAARVIISHLK
jgi:hypothetical protein